MRCHHGMTCHVCPDYDAAELTRLTHELAEARDLLRMALERWDAGAEPCLDCGRWRSQGHAHECRLVAVRR